MPKLGDKEVSWDEYNAAQHNRRAHLEHNATAKERRDAHEEGFQFNDPGGSDAGSGGSGGSGGSVPAPAVPNYDGAPVGTRLPGGRVVNPGETVVHDGNEIRVFAGPAGNRIVVHRDAVGAPGSPAPAGGGASGSSGGGGTSAGGTGGTAGGGGTNGSGGGADPEVQLMLQRLNQQYGGTLPEGFLTPFGPIRGGLINGMGFEYNKLLVERGMAEAANALKQAELSGYLSGLPTVERQRVEAQIAQQAAETEIRKRLADNAIRQTDLDDAFRRSELAERTRQFDVTSGESRRQFDVTAAFEQAKEEARAASNPRDYIYAAMLGQSRGGLGGLRPTNQLVREPVLAGGLVAQDERAMAPVAPAGVSGAGAQGDQSARAPFARAAMQLARGAQVAQGVDGPQGAQGAQAVALGSPGAADHYATAERPDGTRVHYYGTVTRDAQTGEVANIPVGAFARAAMEGRRVPREGSIGTTGGFVSGSALRRSFEPRAIKPRDWRSGTWSEREQLKAVGSAAGYADEDTVEAIERAAPRENAVGGGLRFSSRQ